MLKEMTFQIRKEDNLVNGKIHSSVLSVSESDLIGILLIDLFAIVFCFKYFTIHALYLPQFNLMGNMNFPTSQISMVKKKQM